MRRVALVLSATLGAVLVGSPAAEAAPVGSIVRSRLPPARPGMRGRRFVFRSFPRPPRLRHPEPPPLLPAPPAGEGPAVPPVGPSPLPGEPNGLPAFSHGFHLTVTVGTGATFRVPTVLNRYIDVGLALGACFAPPVGATWGSITLRVSFRRDGSVFGDPRVPYSDAGTPEQKTELARSLLAALKRCTPLPVSPSLGEAIAGEIFAIRFIHQDKP